MKVEKPSTTYATPEDVREATESLSEIDLYKLRKAAEICLPGSDYHDPQELINEAIMRTLDGALGDPGRHWPLDIQFIAYMIMTIRSLASASRSTPTQKKTTHLESMAPEGASVDDVLGALKFTEDDPATLGIRLEEMQARQELAERVSKTVDAHFANDEQVGWIIAGIRDDLTLSEVKEYSGMSQTQYDTARRRFRRGVPKLVGAEVSHG